MKRLCYLLFESLEAFHISIWESSDAAIRILSCIQRLAFLVTWIHMCIAEIRHLYKAAKTVFVWCQLTGLMDGNSSTDKKLPTCKNILTDENCQNG